MDIFRQLFDAALEIECPHCGHREPDDFEVTEPNVVTQTQCQSCKLRFHFGLLECEACDGEFMVSCTARAAAIARLSPVCLMCHLEGAHHENFDTEFL